MERIASRQNPMVRRFRELARATDSSGAALLDGAHLLQEALRSHVPVDVVAIADRATTPDAEALAEEARRTGARVLRVADQVLAAMSPVRQPSGIVSIARCPSRHARTGARRSARPRSNPDRRSGRRERRRHRADSGGVRRYRHHHHRRHRRPVWLEGAARRHGQYFPDADRRASAADRDLGRASVARNRRDCNNPSRWNAPSMLPIFAARQRSSSAARVPGCHPIWLRRRTRCSRFPCGRPSNRSTSRSRPR